MSHPGLTKYMKKNTKYFDQGVTIVAIKIIDMKIVAIKIVDMKIVAIKIVGMKTVAIKKIGRAHV